MLTSALALQHRLRSSGKAQPLPPAVDTACRVMATCHGAFQIALALALASPRPRPRPGLGLEGIAWLMSRPGIAWQGEVGVGTSPRPGVSSVAFKQ